MLEEGEDTYSGYPDARIKHMEMVQAVISRLGSNGFIVKGWAITLVGAFAGFGMTRDQAGLAAVGVALPFFFWLLDATHLRSERAFRLLFEKIRAGEAGPFFMNATASTYIKSLPQEDRDSLSWWRVIGRPGLSVFYGALIASALAVTLFLALADGGHP